MVHTLASKGMGNNHTLPMQTEQKLRNNDIHVLVGATEPHGVH